MASLEYITNPQLFVAPITAAAGIIGYQENYPLVTSYQTWLSTVPVDTTTVPIPGIWPMYDNPSSFLISVSSPVGNYIIPSSHYTVSQAFRTITFNNTIKANTVLEFTQLATVYPFLSNTRFTYLSSVSGSFKTLSAVDSKFDSLLVSNLTALSAVINIIDITQYELSGFNSTGNFNVSGSLAVANDLYVKGAITTDTATNDLTSSNIYVKNALSAYNLNIGNNLNVGTTTSKGKLTVVGQGQSYNNNPNIPAIIFCILPKII
jgi:hypothetical protein